MAGLSVCVLQLVTLFCVLFVFSTGTNLSVLLWKRSRSWCGFCCSKYERELAESFFCLFVFGLLFF